MKSRMSGQGLVEYSLILVLVAIVVIAVLLIVGPAIGDVFSTILSKVDCTQFDTEDPNYCGDNGIGMMVEAVTMAGKKAGKKGYGDGLEMFEEFRELSLYQEESLGEARQELQESVEESLEVLLEYAGEIGDEVLYALISQAQQAASGDYAGLLPIYSELFAAFGEAPQEVRVAVILKAEPNVIKSFLVLDGIQVPYEAFDAALQEFEDLEAQYPGSTGDAIPLLWEAWGWVEQRNSFIDQARPGLFTAACTGIASLYNTGVEEYIELSQQFQAQIPLCTN